VNGATCGRHALVLQICKLRRLAGIFLEDIFVQPQHRGKGIGKLFFVHLAHRAVAIGATHIDWTVLDWNKPSIEFYERLGAASSRRAG